jgi:hypothetical protein
MPTLADLFHGNCRKAQHRYAPVNPALPCEEAIATVCCPKVER